PEGMVGEIGAAFHVVDAGAKGAVAIDPKRQTLDEPKWMNRIEMAQHEDPRRVLTPRRPCEQMIAGAVSPCDAFDGGRHIAVAVLRERRQLVDLLGRIRRRFDFNPPADALKDRFRIEGIARGHRLDRYFLRT